MGSDSESSSDGHVVLLPFMAHGHLIPFLALARKFQERTRFTVTIATTPLNLQYIRSAAAGGSPEIRLAELSFRSADHGLPPDTENTENLPLSQIVSLFHASTSLKGPVERLVEEIKDREGRPPAGLVFDVFLGWAVDIGNKFGIKNITFSTGGAYGTLAYNSMWLHLPHRSTDSDEFEVPGFPNPIRFHRTQLHRFIRDAEPNGPWCIFFQTHISNSLSADAWLCNTVQELEPLPLKLLRDYLKLPVWSIGPLLPISFLHKTTPSDATQRAGKVAGISVEQCTEWLTSHGPDSVLYISFGSQNTISASQMMALAVGLEASQKPFLWVIRPPLGFNIKDDFRSEWLPQGFEQRVTESKQGLLVRTWAPQLEILSHSSTRAFLSHCGWNSVMESLSQGVPMIGWPIAAEQAYNAKMMVEEMGVCVELARGLEKEIQWEEVKRVVEMVMDSESGDEMKRIAMEIGEKIRASVREGGEGRGSSLVAMDEVEKFILSN